MAQIANCFVCWQNLETGKTHSKIIQIPKSVFQSDDPEYIESFIYQKFYISTQILLLNIFILGYYED